MPKKITNPLRSGLPSKIYFLAYSKPISGYQIAKEIYSRDYPPTSKIYNWTKKLEDTNRRDKILFTAIFQSLFEIISYKARIPSGALDYDKLITTLINFPLSSAELYE